MNKLPPPSLLVVVLSGITAICGGITAIGLILTEYLALGIMFGVFTCLFAFLATHEATRWWSLHRTGTEGGQTAHPAEPDPTDQ